jgi:hypothetical protein
MGPYERQRLQENSAQYEGDCEGDVRGRGAAAENAVQAKSINPEDL